MKTILRMTKQEYMNSFDRGRQHAALLYSEWWRTGEATGSSAAFNNAQTLKSQLINQTQWDLPEIVHELREGETIKFLLRFSDGVESESVILPMQSGWTLCVSSQIGCAMGCAFCETGKMGLIRNLKTEEITAQAFIAKNILNTNIRNIVFMGMGEPLDNYDEVMQAVKVLTDPAGFGLASRNITISTSGRVNEIYRLIEDADPSLNLAVSVNAPDDEVRRKIMPINRHWDMTELKKAMQAYCEHPRRSIFAEYVLIQDRNDSVEQADLLAAYLEDLRVKVNVIPYNPQRRDVFQPPSQETIDAFVERLRKHGLRVLLRQNKGRSIMAACGQLGKKQRRAATKASPTETTVPFSTT